MDALIDEILLMSRLDSGSHADLSQDIDLVALAAEEGARYPDCLLSGGAPGISGDPRLLRRLARNLLENAHNHGAPPVEIELSSTAKTATLLVRDGDDGVPEAGREKVFQPFVIDDSSDFARPIVQLQDESFIRPVETEIDDFVRVVG